MKSTQYYIQQKNSPNKNLTVPLTFALNWNTYNKGKWLVKKRIYASWVLWQTGIWFITSPFSAISRQKRDSFVELKNEWESEKVKFKRWNFSENFCLLTLFQVSSIRARVTKVSTAFLSSPDTVGQVSQFF